MRLMLFWLVVSAAATTGCSGPAPDATGEWQGDGDWHARKVTAEVQSRDRQARAMVPSMPLLPVEATLPNKAMAACYTRFRLTLRADGTSLFRTALPPTEDANGNREERNLAELANAVAPMPDVIGTRKQSRWAVTLTDEYGETRELRLLDTSTAVLTIGEERMRLKRVP